MSAAKMRNIGPKSAAWLRQVGLRTRDDLAAVGTVEAYMRVKRAGFRPGLNLLYAIEGALLDCHWQAVPAERRQELVLAADVATALLPPPRHRPAAGPVTVTVSGRGRADGDSDADTCDAAYPDPLDDVQHDPQDDDSVGAAGDA